MSADLGRRTMGESLKIAPVINPACCVFGETELFNMTKVRVAKRKTQRRNV